jgi:hypothetical protein
MERLKELTVNPFETLNAPRIGFDPRANEWARQEYRSPRPNLKREAENVSEEEFLRKLNGFYVVDLIPPCDGVRPGAFGSAGNNPNLLSFRGELFKFCKEIVGEDLVEQAWHSKLADETARYADALLTRAETYAAGHRFAMSELAVRLIDKNRDVMRHYLRAVVDGARWCRFWSSRGHGFHASY